MSARKMDGDKFIMRGLLCFIFIMLCVQTGSAQDMYEDMSRLLEDEFRNYHKDVIPKHRTTDSHVTVKVYPSITRIENLDEDLQELLSTISLTMSWVDDRLAWDPRTYNDVREIHVPASNIWTPDISVSNSVYAADEHDHPATVSYQGRATLTRIVHARTPCEMNYELFPNDEHYCRINITSWKYAGRYLVMEMWNGGTNLSVAMETESSEWIVPGKGQAKLEIVSNADRPEDDFPQLSITLTVKRNSNMQRHIFVTPVVLVSVLLPVQFLVPNQRENRHVFGMLLVICGVLSFINVCLHIPFTYSLPFIGQMHIACISFATLGVVLSSVATSIGSKYSSLRSLTKCKYFRSYRSCIKDNDYLETEMTSLNADHSSKSLEIMLKEIEEIRHCVDIGQCTYQANLCDLVFFFFFLVYFIVEVSVLYINI